MERTRVWLVAALLALIALVAALLPGSGAPARAATATDLLPDLAADPPTNPWLDTYSYAGGGQDLLLRFDGYVRNSGEGALEVDGARSSASDPMVPLQRIFRSDGSYHDDPMPSQTQLFYTNADGHHHWHLQDAAHYSLWNQAKTEKVAPSMKVGFCLGDIQHNPGETGGPETGVYTGTSGRGFCQQNQPDALSLYEGISSHWRDLYGSHLYFQWVVVSDVQPGQYYLREKVDPLNIVKEANENNVPAFSTSPVTIPGYVAKPVTEPAGAYGQDQQISLDANVFGSPGARRFRIVTAPAHGTLDVPTGSNFSTSTITYTPSPGYAGPDQFTYSALDSTSSYPIHPSTATVALSVGPPAPRVVIDSAPTAVQAGHGVQLHATVSNDIGGVTWSVNGVDGGSSRFGTITPRGFYTAPTVVPKSGRVTIAARSMSGASDQRVVRITRKPVPLPAPGTKDPKKLKGILLSTIATARVGNVVAASVIPDRAGLVWIGMRVGRHHLGSCRGLVPKGRRFTCRVNVKPGTSLARLRVLAKLTRSRQVIASIRRTGEPPAGQSR